MKHLASFRPDDIEGPIAVAASAIDAHEWQEARNALASHLEGRPPARICALMARIEAGEGDKGREREWLARAVRAPRDRAWIADGYVSDRWLPVSPVTGAVDGFEWKAPVDAIGRGDETILIADERASAALEIPDEVSDAPEPVRQIRTEARESPVRDKTIEPSAPVVQVIPRRDSDVKPKPRVFVPDRPPDDPGVTASDTEELQASLERLRAAQIR